MKLPLLTLSWFAAVMSGLLAVASSMLVVRWLENTEFPAIADWHATAISLPGDDVYITGAQRKVRDCKFIAPIRAETASGVHLVVKSLSPTAGQNWQADGGLRTFGPWLVIGGAGHRIRLYAEHQCHPFWPTFSTLGTIEAKRATP